jgi:glycerophosphoryl diester phosphodiesterase
VFVWTANDAATFSRMVSRGVDGLITDYPDLAREIVEQRADLGGVERLLLDLALSLGVEAAPVDIAAETQGES